MLAQPGHPVFLDTLGRIMQDIDRNRKVRVIEVEGEERPMTGKWAKDLDVVSYISFRLMPC